MIACLFIYFRNGKCLTNEFFKGCGKEIQFTLSTENIIYIMTIMAFWASKRPSKKFSFSSTYSITMMDGNEEVKLWLACVAGGNVQSRKVLEENAAIRRRRMGKRFHQNSHTQKQFCQLGRLVYDFLTTSSTKYYCCIWLAASCSLD